MFDNILSFKPIKYYKTFLQSHYFPLFLMALTFILYCLAWDIVGFLLLGFFVLSINLLCDDLRPIFAVGLIMPYVVSMKNSPGYMFEGYYTNSGIITTLFIIGTIVVLAFILRMFIYKGIKTIFKNSKLIYGFLALVPCYILAGAFSKYYEINNFLVAIIMIATHTILYIFISPELKYKEDNMLYISRVCVLSTLLIVLQIAYIYISRYEIGAPLNDKWKGKLIFGVLVSNSAAEFIVMFLPFFFYLTATQKRGWIYYLLSIICLIAVYFTLSRAGLLFGFLSFIVGSIILCFFGKNKKVIRWIILAFILIIVLVIAYIFINNNQNNFFKFFIDNKLNDRGRFERWQFMWDKFLLSPIFGAGFSPYLVEGEQPLIYLSLAHNTWVQIITSCGIIGTILYLFHRYQTIKVVVKNINVEKIVISLSILLFMGMGLLDQIFFFPNFTVIYTMLLCFIEKQEMGQQLKSLFKRGT